MDDDMNTQKDFKKNDLTEEINKLRQQEVSQ